MVSWSGLDAECDLDGWLDACATALHRDPGDERFMLRRIGQRVTRPDPRGNGTPARASSTLDLPLLWSPITHILVACFARVGVEFNARRGSGGVAVVGGMGGGQMEWGGMANGKYSTSVHKYSSIKGSTAVVENSEFGSPAYTARGTLDQIATPEQSVV